MTLLHLHHGDLHDAAADGRSMLARVFRWLYAALTTMHRAIVDAKLRRLQSELNFYGYADDQGEEPSTDDTVRKSPRRPLILGDKWDF